MTSPTEPFAVPIEWRSFIDGFRRRWKPGEHVSLIGSTGSGKTTLALQLLADRAGETVVIATKDADEVATRASRLGFVAQERLALERREGGEVVPQRVILWPRCLRGPQGERMTLEQTAACQKQAVRRALETIRHTLYLDWTIYVDEVAWLAKRAGLADYLTSFWQQGRSARRTVVAATQRPRAVPREMFSEPSHLFFFRLTDTDDLRRLAEVGGGIPWRQLADEVATLKRHEWIYLSPREQPPFVFRSTAPAITPAGKGKR